METLTSMKFKKLQDKLSRLVWNMFESAKDSVNNSLITLVRDKKLEVSDINLLMTVIASSLESSYHNSHQVFEKSVEDAAKEEFKAQVATEQVSGVKSSKKS